MSVLPIPSEWRRGVAAAPTGRRVSTAECEHGRKQHDDACPLGAPELPRQRTRTGTARSPNRALRPCR